MIFFFKSAPPIWGAQFVHAPNKTLLNGGIRETQVSHCDAVYEIGDFRKSVKQARSTFLETDSTKLKIFIIMEEGRGRDFGKKRLCIGSR